MSFSIQFGLFFTAMSLQIALETSDLPGARNRGLELHNGTQVVCHSQTQVGFPLKLSLNCPTEGLFSFVVEKTF
jgi:hypothetical protein